MSIGGDFARYCGRPRGFKCLCGWLLVCASVLFDRCVCSLWALRAPPINQELNHEVVSSTLGCKIDRKIKSEAILQEIVEDSLLYVTPLALCTFSFNSSAMHLHLKHCALTVHPRLCADDLNLMSGATQQAHNLNSLLVPLRRLQAVETSSVRKLLALKVAYWANNKTQLQQYMD